MRNHDDGCGVCTGGCGCDPSVPASPAQGAPPVFGTELEYPENVFGFLARVGFGKGDGAFAEAKRVCEKLLGTKPEAFRQSMEAAEAVEAARYHNMRTFKRPRLRPGKPDDGVSVFLESFGDGVKNVTLAPAIAKVKARGWELSNVFVKRMKVGDGVFMFIWFEPVARTEFTEAQTEAVTDFLSQSFGFLHFFENSASSGSLTANVNFSRDFWQPKEKRSLPANDFDFVGNTWRGQITPNAAYLARRQAREARQASAAEQPKNRAVAVVAAANDCDRRFRP